MKDYKPGSDEAIENGCTCPVLDNGHGKGAYTDEDGAGVYWYSSDCPLHGRGIEVKGEDK